MTARAQLLIELADDELILGWRDSEWTGIAPFLEEDVAFSSIAQNEIGHARALYEVAARELGTDADSLAFDRRPEEYRCAPLVQARLVPDWAATIARHYLYETADAIRLESLASSDDVEVAGLAAKMAREELYHRLHAEMWAKQLREEQRFLDALDAQWRYALGVLGEENQRLELVKRVHAFGFEPQGAEPVERGLFDEFTPLWEEMTMVRRSAPVGSQW
ncbi:MAG: 1,2-phenylacetyl-CoA epoxidase subunit PaaC [Gaiellaceae bacterium]